MDTRVALISIIVEQDDAIEELNTLLHEARQYIIGRMGIPYRAKGISIISIAIDAPQDKISALSGKIGRLKGVSAKTAYSNVMHPFRNPLRQSWNIILRYTVTGILYIRECRFLRRYKSMSVQRTVCAVLY